MSACCSHATMASVVTQWGRSPACAMMGTRMTLPLACVWTPMSVSLHHAAGAPVSTPKGLTPATVMLDTPRTRLASA